MDNPAKVLLYFFCWVKFLLSWLTSNMHVKIQKDSCEVIPKS